MYFQSAKYKINPLHISNWTFILFNDSEYVTYCDGSFTLKSDLTNVIASYTLRDKSIKTETYEKIVASGSVSLCQPNLGGGISFLALVVLELTKKFSNFKAECPLKKGDYYLRNASISDTRLVPNFLLGASKQRKFSATLKAKPSGSKLSTEIIKYELYGTIDADAT